MKEYVMGGRVRKRGRKGERFEEAKRIQAKEVAGEEWRGDVRSGVEGK